MEAYKQRVQRPKERHLDEVPKVQYQLQADLARAQGDQARTEGDAAAYKAEVAGKLANQLYTADAQNKANDYQFKRQQAYAAKIREMEEKGGQVDDEGNPLYEKFGDEYKTWLQEQEESVNKINNPLAKKVTQEWARTQGLKEYEEVKSLQTKLVVDKGRADTLSRAEEYMRQGKPDEVRRELSGAAEAGFFSLGEVKQYKDKYIYEAAAIDLENRALAAGGNEMDVMAKLEYVRNPDNQFFTDTEGKKSRLGPEAINGIEAAIKNEVSFARQQDELQHRAEYSAADTLLFEAMVNRELSPRLIEKTAGGLRREQKNLYDRWMSEWERDNKPAKAGATLYERAEDKAQEWLRDQIYRDINSGRYSVEEMRDRIQLASAEVGDIFVQMGISEEEAEEFFKEFDVSAIRLNHKVANDLLGKLSSMKATPVITESYNSVSSVIDTRLKNKTLAEVEKEGYRQQMLKYNEALDNLRMYANANKLSDAELDTKVREMTHNTIVAMTNQEVMQNLARPLEQGMVENVKQPGVAFLDMYSSGALKGLKWNEDVVNNLNVVGAVYQDLWKDAVGFDDVTYSISQDNDVYIDTRASMKPEFADKYLGDDYNARFTYHLSDAELPGKRVLELQIYNRKEKRWEPVGEELAKEVRVPTTRAAGRGGVGTQSLYKIEEENSKNKHRAGLMVVDYRVPEKELEKARAIREAEIEESRNRILER